MAERHLKNLANGNVPRLVVCGLNFRPENIRGQLKNTFCVSMLPGKRLMVNFAHGMLLPSRKTVADLLRKGRELNRRRKENNIGVAMKVFNAMESCLSHDVKESEGSPVLNSAIMMLRMNMMINQTAWRNLLQPDSPDEIIEKINTEQIQHCGPCPERGNCLQGNFFGRKIKV